jgi:signal transduction histidine kinase
MLLDANVFIDGVIEQSFNDTTLSQTSSLLVAFQGSVLTALGGAETEAYLSKTEELQGSLLLQDSLSTPLGRMELIFSVNALPAGPGGTIIIWTSVILSIMFMGGFGMMYRLGVRQITLARQQQDFVSAVSHELKTPLTSIRMYGEMLREGWTTEEKRKTYYDFIYDESERLTRLINNVLQLARMTRNDLQVELKPCAAAQLMDTIQSKIGSQIESAGFVLNVDCDEQAQAAMIEVDADYFTQIVINLVDNGIKFSAKSEKQQIDIRCKLLRDDKLQISIRDYGPGVPRDQMRKIFHLFYRSENELTRETVGTGIGLALVHQLTLAMHGYIDVVNRDPGAEFQISFPVVKALQR